MEDGVLMNRREAIARLAATTGTVAIGQFMVVTATDCYDDAAFSAFRTGLRKVDAASKKRHGKTFMESNTEERTALLNDLNAEQRTYERERRAASLSADADP
jgi:hypothetical protein